MANTIGGKIALSDVDVADELRESCTSETNLSVSVKS